MIVAEITHGLGNQMFQYAAARRLAVQHQTSLKLDLQYFQGDGARRYGLGDFRVQAEQVTWSEVARLCPNEVVRRSIDAVKSRRLRSALHLTLDALLKPSAHRKRAAKFSPSNILPVLRHGRVVAERVYHYDEDMLTCPDNVWLTGYWQSERYFADIADHLRAEFTLRSPLAGLNLEMARQIESAEAVALHIRRGDKATDAGHLATSREQVERAMRFFREQLSSPVFYVFSDDWGWVERELSDDKSFVFVRHNGPGQESEDLRLMSLCKHNILAASTFSWWGAWLNTHPEKIVLHPGHDHWLRIANHDTRDVFPPEWISMQCLPVLV